jgi:hypothetical protein
MKCASVALAVALTVLCLATTASARASSVIDVQGEHIFKQLITDGDVRKLTLFEWYARGNPHCDQFRKVYSDIGFYLKNTYKAMINIAMMESTTYERLARDHDVEKHPTFMLFGPGCPATGLWYEGDLDQEELTDFVETHIREHGLKRFLK